MWSQNKFPLHHLSLTGASLKAPHCSVARLPQRVVLEARSFALTHLAAGLPFSQRLERRVLSLCHGLPLPTRSEEPPIRRHCQESFSCRPLGMYRLEKPAAIPSSRHTFGLRCQTSEKCRTLKSGGTANQFAHRFVGNSFMPTLRPPVASHGELSGSSPPCCAAGRGPLGIRAGPPTRVRRRLPRRPAT
jgi:hypothetical protein